MACGILVPQPGVKPVRPALEAWSVNHWTAREVPNFFFLFNLFLAALGLSCSVRALLCGTWAL